MTVSVVMPYRETDAYRARAWEHVQGFYRECHPDWQVVSGTCLGPDWTKAEAVADALRQAVHDVLVIADADVLVRGLDRAVQLVRDGAPWVVGHVHVHRLTEAATAHYLATGEDTGEREKGCPYVGVEGGGVVVLRRETYEAVPLDGRFTGYGAEDYAWGDALNVLVGPCVRLDESLLHLWHPPQPGRPNRRDPARPESADLRSQYLSARRRHERDPCNPAGREAMEALVAEASHLTCAPRP